MTESVDLVRVMEAIHVSSQQQQVPTRQQERTGSATDTGNGSCHHPALLVRQVDRETCPSPLLARGREEQRQVTPHRHDASHKERRWGGHFSPTDGLGG